MIPSFGIPVNTMSAALAIAAVNARGDWEDIILETGIDALAYAKANAPWADRTGEARSGLDVEVASEGDEIILTLFHTVEYGKWLETIQAGSLAIILPTLEIYGPEIKRRIEGA